MEANIVTVVMLLPPLTVIVTNLKQQQQQQHQRSLNTNTHIDCVRDVKQISNSDSSRQSPFECVKRVPLKQAALPLTFLLRKRKTI